MTYLKRPLVLVHGLWNNPKLFDRLKSQLSQDPSLVITPYLPHDFGKINLRDLCFHLDYQITQTLGSECSIDLLGFSMGGLVARLWLQEMNGYKRVRRFFSVGSPHNGTLTAQIVPASMFPGIADMKLGSQLIKSLNKYSINLATLECKSYFSYWDLMVFPGYRAILPCGPSMAIPVLTHKCLIKNPKSLKIISRDLLNG